MRELVAVLLGVFLSFSVFANSMDDYIREVARENGIEALERLTTNNQALFDLGKRLYQENLLSGNKNISCQSCHHPNFASGDALPLPIGEGGVGIGTERRLADGQIIPRNSPPVFNLGHESATHMFWDGRVAFDKGAHTFQTPEEGLNGDNPELKEYTRVLTSALAAQAMFPPTSHEEMRGARGTNFIADAKSNVEVWERLTARIVGIPMYRALIYKAYPELQRDQQINFAHLANAIAEFEKVEFQATNTNFDRFLRGENGAMREQEKRGALVFLEKGKCAECHSGPLLSNMDFHNVAFAQIGPGKEDNKDDKGLYLLTGKEEDLYKFKTTPLRNVALTAPYGHSGGMFTLRDVLIHYFHPMRTLHHYDPDFSGLPYDLYVERQFQQERTRRIDHIIGVRGLPITAEDILDLEVFLMESLTEK